MYMCWLLFVDLICEVNLVLFSEVYVSLKVFIVLYYECEFDINIFFIYGLCLRLMLLVIWLYSVSELSLIFIGLLFFLNVIDL